MHNIKQCNQCGKSKPLTEYHKMSASKDGRQPKCKSCVKIVNENFREEKPEYQIQWQRINHTKWLEYVTNWDKKNRRADTSRSKIYFCINPNGFVYVGHTQTLFAQRKSAHKTQWNYTNKRLPYLHKSFDEYGFEAHKWEVIDMAGVDKETLKAIEYTMINQFHQLGLSLNKRLK